MSRHDGSVPAGLLDLPAPVVTVLARLVSERVWLPTDIAALRYGFPDARAFRRWAEASGVTLVRRGRASRALVVATVDVDRTLINTATGRPLVETRGGRALLRRQRPRRTDGRDQRGATS